MRLTRRSPHRQRLSLRDVRKLQGEAGKTEKSGCPCRTHSATPIGRMATSWPAKPSLKVTWRWKSNFSFARGERCRENSLDRFHAEEF